MRYFPQVIKWLTLDDGYTDFSRILKPKMEKMGTLEKNGDPKSEKGPHGDPCGSSDTCNKNYDLVCKSSKVGFQIAWINLGSLYLSYSRSFFPFQNLSALPTCTESIGPFLGEVTRPSTQTSKSIKIFWFLVWAFFFWSAEYFEWANPSINFSKHLDRDKYWN